MCQMPGPIVLPVTQLTVSKELKAVVPTREKSSLASAFLNLSPDSRGKGVMLILCDASIHTDDNDTINNKLQ